MNEALRQAGRIGRLSTALGPDELVLLRFDGADHLNDLFEYRVEALSNNRNLDFDALVGTHATVSLDAKEERHFDGIVTQARWTGAGENGHRYELILRPWFWLAGRRRNQRIFHDKTVVQILQELLSDYAGLGDPAMELALNADYPELEYTVQYRESDLDFARRQMERHGISFYFKHVEGSHTLVLTDDVAGHLSVGERKLHPHDGHHMAEDEHFWEWAPERNLTTGAVRLTDYNFKTPLVAMEVERLGDAAYAQGQIESFDYPGDYLERGRGKSVAGLRTDGERGGDRRYRAAGDCLSLGAGMQVTLGSSEEVPGAGETFLVLTALYHFVSEAYGSGSPLNDGYAFTGAWTMTPASAPMMPPRRTAVPVVQGPQTAMVVGEGEIDCDKYGRILVRFHWDLKAAHSMRCRVSQNWAGAGWGGMVIPRIGMEVVVEFLEGDPDKPLVTGCVYNAQTRVPYDLPENKTRSTFKSNTHQGKGFNELRFEDERGREEVMLHGQRDGNVVIRRDWLTNVGRSSFNDVAVHHFERAGGNYVREAKGTVEISSGQGTLISSGRMNLSSLGFSEIPICEEPSFHRDKLSLAGMNSASRNGGIVMSAETILMEQVGLSKTSIVGGASQEVVGIDKTMTIGKTFRLASGGTVSMAAADNVTTEAGDRIDLVCGDCSIRMTADGNMTIAAKRIRFRADQIDEN